MANESKRGVAGIAAHAAGAEIMRGTANARDVDQEWKAVGVHMTRGEKRHPECPPEEISATKKVDIENGTTDLGSDTGDTPSPARALSVSQGVRVPISEVIRQNSPSIMLSPPYGSSRRERIGIPTNEDRFGGTWTGTTRW